MTTRQHNRRRRVLVAGGGIAGMTAAHELAERGFEVHVYERLERLGGKARSFAWKAGRAAGLPGEHGFRFFHAGYYLHTFDSMRRTPLPGGGTAFDNLVEVDEQFNSGELYGPETTANLPGWLLKLLSSGHDRMLHEYEDMAFEDFVDGARYSPTIDDDAATHVIKETPKVLQAVNGSDCSTRAMGLLASRLGDPLVRPAMILNGPTNQAWIDPWQRHLEALGVRFHLGHAITDITIADDRVVEVSVLGPKGEHRVTADFYIAAVPAGVMLSLTTEEMTQADPRLAGIEHLREDWMVGFQFYLVEPVRNLPRGHWGFGKTPFKLSGIQQTDFWSSEALAVCDSHECKAILSVIISDFDTPGIVFGKPARRCTPDEIEQELWAQLALGFQETPYAGAFSRAKYIAFECAPDVHLTGDDDAHNEMPLFMNSRGALWHRPRAVSAISNLFLAGDYVHGSTDICTMEAANEAARRAVNGILRAADDAAEPCRLFDRDQQSADTTAIELLRAVDDFLFLHGAPHVLDLVDSRTAGDLVDALQIFTGFGLYREGSSAGRLADAVASTAREVAGHLRDRGILSAPGFASVARAKDAAPSSAGALDLRSRVRSWGNVDMELAGRLAEHSPGFLERYLDVSSPIYAPLLDVCRTRGAQHRVDFVLGLNAWLDAPLPLVHHIVELGQFLHNCSLVVDDILDDSPLRRAEPATWVTHGMPASISAAYSGVFQVLLSTAIHLGDASLAIVVEEVARAHHANALELHFRRTKTCPSEADYLAIADGKTGSAFRMIGRLLCVHARRTITPQVRVTVEALARSAGRFFQIRDDYLDLWSADYARKKGTAFSDFAEGKHSYPITRYLAASPASGDEMFVAFGSGTPPTPAQQERLDAILRKSGARDATVAALSELRGELLDRCTEISVLVADEGGEARLHAWVERLCEPLPKLATTTNQVRPVRQRTAVERAWKLDFGACLRAVRSVLAFHDVHCPLRGWSSRDFWHCFPVLITAEVHMFAIDDDNERGDDVDRDAFEGPIRTLVERAGWSTAEVDAILRDAFDYYRGEREWHSGVVGDAREWSRMVDGKATDFRMLTWLAERILGQSEEAALVGEHVLTRHAMLAIDERQEPRDRERGAYNLRRHHRDVFGDRADEHWAETRSRLTHELHTRGLDEAAARWVEWMGETPSMRGGQAVSLDVSRLLAIGDRIAGQCLDDPALAAFCVSPAGSWQWIANELRGSTGTTVLSRF